MGCAKAGAAKISVSVKQALLRSVMPDGTVFQLVVLPDNRCAILRDGVAAFESPGDEAGIDDAVQRFTALTRSRPEYAASPSDPSAPPAELNLPPGAAPAV
jgi:hypothetical protein